MENRALKSISENERVLNSKLTIKTIFYDNKLVKWKGDIVKSIPANITYENDIVVENLISEILEGENVHIENRKKKIDNMISRLISKGL